jgi:predicted SnoaL-like aldol condensation-catalyzing enzyme
MPKTELERNKGLVVRLFEIIYGDNLAEINLIDGLVAVNYIQHNPRAAQGREGLRSFLREVVAVKEIKAEDTLNVNLIAEGDHVVRQEMRTNGMLIDIFRVEDGLLKEHWDAFRFAPGAKVIPGF